MRSLLKKIFLEHWIRKLISLGLAIIIWFVVSQTLTVTKTISSVPVRIINLPQGKTVEGLQSNGYLSKRVTITVSGNKNILEELTSNDIEIVVDATGKQGEWVETITKKNISSTNAEINVTRAIGKVSHKNFIIKMTKLSSEKIPVLIMQPTGEAPKGYQFLDVWPYQLYITIQGPDDILKKIKSRGVKLTFNLNDISKAQLDDLQLSSLPSKSDVVSYYVPNHWKQVLISAISEIPLEINDPDAKYLRIDFIKSELVPIKSPVPVDFYVPPPYTNTINAQKIHIATNDIIETRNGLKILKTPLFAKGVSELFVEIIKDMFEISVIVAPKTENQILDWSVQFINPSYLENKYVSTLISDISDEEMQPQLREEYLRNRFRNYMNRFQLFKQSDQKLELSIQLQGNSVIINEKGMNGG